MAIKILIIYDVTRLRYKPVGFQKKSKKLNEFAINFLSLIYVL